MEVIKEYRSRSGIICKAIACSVSCGESLYKAVTILGGFSGGIKNILHPIESPVTDSNRNEILYLSANDALKKAVQELDAIMFRHGFKDVEKSN